MSAVMVSHVSWRAEPGEKGGLAGPALAVHKEGGAVVGVGQVADRLPQLRLPPQKEAAGSAAQLRVVQDLGGQTALRGT